MCSKELLMRCFPGFLQLKMSYTLTNEPKTSLTAVLQTQGASKPTAIGSYAMLTEKEAQESGKPVWCFCQVAIIISVVSCRVVSCHLLHDTSLSLLLSCCNVLIP